MPVKAINTILLTIICMLFVPIAQAHTGIPKASGLAAGFMHPLTGLDHLLMALAAGYWAGLTGWRSAKGVLFFLSLLVAGMLLGTLYLAYPALAIIPGLTLLLAAAVIAVAIGLPRLFTRVFFGSFALYHGLAHMLEIPAAVSVAGYILGLLSATALLLCTGIALRQIAVTGNYGPVARNWLYYRGKHTFPRYTTRRRQ